MKWGKPGCVAAPPNEYSTTKRRSSNSSCLLLIWIGFAPQFPGSVSSWWFYFSWLHPALQSAFPLSPWPFCIKRLIEIVCSFYVVLSLCIPRPRGRMLYFSSQFANFSSVDVCVLGGTRTDTRHHFPPNLQVSWNLSFLFSWFCY